MESPEMMSLKHVLQPVLPRGKKQFLARLLHSSGINALLKVLPTWSGLLVVNYHRIGDPETCPLDRNLYSASPEILEQQVRSFQSHADVVGIADLDDIFAVRRRGKYLLITFDDGYRDNYEAAFPVLQARRAKATFFIATGFINQPRVAWWDELAWMVRNAQVTTLPANRWFSQPVSLTPEAQTVAVGRAVQRYWSLPGSQTQDFLHDFAVATRSGRAPQALTENLWMTWDMLQEMVQAGMDLGGHTVDHPVLAQESVARQRKEISRSRQELIEKTGHVPLAFSYPVGQRHMFTEQTEQLVREAGYRWGFSFYGNYAKPEHASPYDLPRCAIDYGLSPSYLRSRLTLPQIFSRK